MFGKKNFKRLIKSVSNQDYCNFKLAISKEPRPGEFETVKKLYEKMFGNPPSENIISIEMKIENVTVYCNDDGTTVSYEVEVNETYYKSEYDVWKMRMKVYVNTKDDVIRKVFKNYGYYLAYKNINDNYVLDEYIEYKKNKYNVILNSKMLQKIFDKIVE